MSGQSNAIHRGGLRRALERQEFVLQYQPKIDLKTGAISGAEALIRWLASHSRNVAPARFISIAEDCGLILPIDNWVFVQRASKLGPGGCRLARDDHGSERLRDGVAGRELPGRVVQSWVKRLDPRSLEVELTEVFS